jgi:hypothetical protein
VKFSKVLRFMYRVPPSVLGSVETWIAVPASGKSSSTLFTRRHDSGRIITPNADVNDCNDIVERRILNNCVVLSTGQRCADWFVLRQFRVTGTNASKILMSEEGVRAEVGYPLNLDSPQRTTNSIRSSSEVLQDLGKSWFSSARSTEVMMRGTENEVSVMNALRRKEFVRGLFEVGMIGKKGKDWVACSPDGIAVIDLKKLSDFDTPQVSHSQVPLPWMARQQFDELPGLEGRCVLSSVEIKTRVASPCLERSIQLASLDVTVCRVGDSTFQNLIPEAHFGPLLHQMLVLRVNHVMYVSAAETGITFIVVAYCDLSILSFCEYALEQAVGDCVLWAHAKYLSMPVIEDAELRKLIDRRLPFWSLVNTYVLENDAFYPPLKLFRHGVQTLYSKTKGSLDGSAQARAILRSSTSSLK